MVDEQPKYIHDRLYSHPLVLRERAKYLQLVGKSPRIYDKLSSYCHVSPFYDKSLIVAIHAPNVVIFAA